IAHALLVEPEKFGWMIPFATLGLGGVLAVFTGTATWLAHLTRVRGPGRVAMLAATWTLMEWARSWVLTGLPWNPVGSVWDPVLPVLQFGAVAGVFGLSLVTVLAAALPALLADRLTTRAKAAILALAAGLPLALGLWGAARLSSAGPAPEVAGVRLRLVQAAIGQSHKWKEELRQAHLDAYVRLSRSAGFESVTHVVWPETAAPFFLDMDAANRSRVAQAAPPGGMVLTGAPRVTPRETQPFQVWNSLMAVTALGDVVATYDKVHLVPFGEYVPFRAVLPASLNIGGHDFSPGPGLRTLDLPGLPPFSPLICYEAIFPAAVVGRDEKRPAWLLNVTNDAWFGLSAGPYQHLASARMRAIEEGLPLVRAANTGVSAVFDGHGREIARLGLGEQGVVDSQLPAAPGEVTVFSRLGNLSALLMAAMVALLGFATRKEL
ncbi:MAG TPA: apolipoprotein N-acyltransferase, partial [Candidatus Omnitrophota bacterium]|nr:apolipoprotein N-acyltransferase [Candidatus Omnitrophota bacterium]